MAGSVNKVILVGNLGKDPETKNFENGGVICSFSIATTESYWDKEKNQRIDQPTDWHNIRVGKPGLAKIAQQYLRKGSSVYVEGAIRYRQYQSKEGETKYFTEVHVEELVLLGKPGSPAEATASAEGARSEEIPPANFSPADGDDLPF
jgi:single-strand DNA-binding protein